MYLMLMVGLILVGHIYLARADLGAQLKPLLVAKTGVAKLFQAGECEECLCKTFNESRHRFMP